MLSVAVVITVLTSVLGVITTTLLDVKPATAAPSTARVSTTSSAGQASGWQAAISADGNWVAFVSNSTALSTNPSGYNQVYRKNLSTGAVDLVSVNTSGAVGTGNSASPAISKDGRYVAFDSDAADLVAGDTNGYRDVFIRDFGVTPAATSLVSAPASGGSAAGASYSPSVSGDGNRVAFESNASLNPDDANCGAADVYLRDRAAATTTRVSKIVGWSPASANQCGSQYISTFEDAHVGRQAISADGRYVVFRGHWSGSPLHNGACDYASSEVNQPFAYDSLTGKTPAVGGEWAMGCDGALPAISPDGSIVAYADHSWTGFYVASPAGTATIGGYTGGDPAYHVNVLPGGTAPNASISDPVLSNTGARIAFSSTASNIAAGDTNGREDVFYLDWGPTASAQVSLTSAGADPQSFSSSAPAGSTAPSIASDGTAIAYGSVASDLVSGDTNGLSDVFTRTGLSTPAPASLTVAMLLGGGNNPAIKCLLCQAVEHNFGRPVDAATGNFWHSFDDLSIPGRGMPLDFTRTYNSAASTAKGPLGYGWTEPYNMSITNPDGSAIAGSPSAVVVNQENAAQVPFNGTGGAYQPPSFVQASLVHNADSTWTFTRNAKEVFTFSPTGALTSEKTLNPEVTTVSAVANNTQTIADSGGRTFTLAYWPTGSGSGKDNLIHTVTDSGGRVVTFDYADNNSNLTDVTDVGGGHSQFAYDGSHHVVEMRSANFASDGAMPTPPSSCSPSTGPAHVTANVYDAQGRVICQYDPDGNKTSFDYSTPGTTKVTDPRGNVTTQTFSNYLLTSEIKGTGTPQQATWTYTTNPLTLGVASVTDPNGAVQTYNYDNFGNVVGSTDGLGRRTLKTYDSLNDLTSVTDPKGVLTTMAYDADGNLVSRSTPLDGHTCPDPPGPPTYCQVYTYSRTDSAHPDDVITYSDPSSTGSGNRAWTYNYDPGSGNLLSEQDSLGNKTMYCYDSIGRRFETMAPAGSSGFSCPASTPPTPGAHGTVFLYNNFGDVTKTTDSLSHSTTSTFDADRNLLSTTDAKGNVTSYGYDPAGQRTSQTAADATTTTYGYDPAGNRTSVGAPGAPAVSDGFNRAGGTLGTADTGQGWQNIYGSPAVMTNKFGPSTVANAAAYVNAGTGMANASVRATTTLSTTGGSSFPYLILRVVNTNTWLYVYLNTSTSKVSLWKDQGGVFSAVDPTDHPYAPTFAAGGTYTVAATMNGANISVAINGAALFSYALSSADQTTFDAATSDGLGMNVANTTQQQVRWDDFSISPLTSTTDAFDPLNRMSGETDQLGRTTAYSYDGAGNRLTKQDPGGNCSTTPKTGCTTSTYDAANELKTVTYSDGTTPNVSSISYDADGQRTDMTDGAGTSHWDWDSLHRMTTSRIGTSGAVTTYSYDLANRPTVTTYPGSKAVTRGYDAAGRPATVADWLSHTTTYSPDADGNLHTADTPLSGATQRDTWNYNPADQLTSTQFGTTTNAAALGSLTYGPDANGMLATQNDTTPGTLNHSYLYDNANRLASADSSPYAYDQAGDATQLGTGPRQAFDNANQACFQSATSAPGTCAAPPAAATTFGYDTRGNRTTQSIAGIGGTNYSYDQANRLTQAAPAAPSGNQGQYNALTGARILDTGATPPTGSCPGTTCANIPAGGTLKVQVTGQGGVPASGVGAVNLAVSVLNASSAGLVTLWPSDAPQPGTSNVNYPLNTWTSNMAIVKVAADGTISIYNNGGSVRVLLDVSGWYATSSGQPGSGFNALTGSRILDTRVPTGTCVPGPCGRIAANSILKLQVGGQGGVPTTAKAVAINVTATGQAGGTNLIVWPDGQAMPGVTSVVVPTTGNKSQLVEVPLPAGGSGVVDIYSWLAATDVVVDVVGWYGSTATSLYQPLAGSRSMDTRSAPLSVCPDGCQKLVAGGTLVLHVTGRNGVPAQGVSAVAVNITTTNASSGGYLTAWPSDQARPATSLSFPPSQDTGNAAIVKVAGDGTISIYNAQGSVDLVVDVEGYYLQPAPTSTYTYNGDGLRTSKTVSGTVTNFTWDESGALAQLSGDGTYTYVYGPDGTPLEQVSGTTVTWLHHDREGTTRLLTNSSAAVAGTAAYDPYGQLLFRTGATSTLGYTGQFTDAETGFQYLRARYYDPATGQFISRDPITAVTGAPYGYASNDPLNAVDPTGLSTCGKPHGFFDRIGSGIDCLSKGQVNVDVSAYVIGGGHVGVNLNLRHPMSSSLEGGIGIGLGGGVSVASGSTPTGESYSRGFCLLVVCFANGGGTGLTGFGPKAGVWASWDFTTAPFKDWGSHGADCNPLTDADCPIIPTASAASYCTDGQAGTEPRAVLL